MATEARTKRKGESERKKELRGYPKTRTTASEEKKKTQERRVSSKQREDAGRCRDAMQRCNTATAQVLVY